ncbi:MAG: hypothetical protein LBC72_05980, partial [Spirochaetaceae bacterium]|nr:hypothetical protein [Spirochaetaceae bacterium]
MQKYAGVMLKKKITVLLLAFALSSGAFAQDNAVLVGFGGGFNFPFMFYSDIHCSYECMLTSNMSLRVNAA